MLSAPHIQRRHLASSVIRQIGYVFGLPKQLCEPATAAARQSGVDTLMQCHDGPRVRRCRRKHRSQRPLVAERLFGRHGVEVEGIATSERIAVHHGDVHETDSFEGPPHDFQGTLARIAFDLDFFTRLFEIIKKITKKQRVGGVVRRRDADDALDR